jgi:radical SAM protein with 4Fe4S-binding SPASM domain
VTDTHALQFVESDGRRADVSPTYCPKLWNSAFISQNGDVFKCCHATDARLGNIYEEALSTIWNGPRYLTERTRSLAGQLSCYDACTILDKARINVPSGADARPDYSALSQLHILFGEGCNIACVMCWQAHGDRAELSFERLIEHVGIEHVTTLKLQGGEPLKLKSCERYFRYAAARGKRLSFLTNGTLINEEWAALIAEHSDTIAVSLNAATKDTHESINRGSRWDDVLANIRRLRDVRDERRSRLKIVGHMTIIPTNVHEIGAFIEGFGSFGCDAANFGYSKAVPELLGRDPVLMHRTAAEVAAALEHSPAPERVELFRLRKLGLLREDPRS